MVDKVYRKQFQTTRSSSNQSSESTLVPNRPRLLPVRVVATKPTPQHQTNRPRKLQKQDKREKLSYVGHASIAPLPFGLEVTNLEFSHPPRNLDNKYPTLANIEHVATFSDENLNLQSLQLDHPLVDNLDKEIHGNAAGAQISTNHLQLGQVSDLRSDTNANETALQEAAECDVARLGSREHAITAASEERQDADHENWLACISTHDLAQEEESTSPVVTPTLTTIATASPKASPSQSLLRCDSRIFSTLPGFAAYMVQNFPCDYGSRGSTVKSIIPLIAPQVVFRLPHLEDAVNRRIFETIQGPFVPMLISLDSQLGLCSSNLVTSEELPRGLSCACHEKLREMELDYEVATRMMEQRHETELAMVRDDHEAELSGLKDEQEKIVVRQSGRINRLRGLHKERTEEVAQLKQQQQDQAQATETRLEMLQRQYVVLADENSQNSRAYTEARQAYRELQSQQLSAQSAALEVQHHQNSATNSLRRELAESQRQLGFAMERERGLMTSLREMVEQEAGYQREIQVAKEQTEDLRRLNNTILQHKHLEYQQRESWDSPMILKPDEVQAAERALLMSQHQLQKCGEELTTSNQHLGSAMEKIKELMEEKELLQANLATYDDAHLIAANVAEVYETLADRFIEAAVSVPANDAVKQFCLKSLETAVSKTVQSNRQAEQIVDLRVALRDLNARCAQQEARWKAKVQELDEKLRETDGKLWTEQSDLAILLKKDKQLKEELEATELDCANWKAQVETQAFGSDRECVLKIHQYAIDQLEAKIGTLSQLVCENQEYAKVAGTSAHADQWDLIKEAGCVFEVIEERDALLIKYNLLLDHFKTELAQTPLEIDPTQFFIKHTDAEQQSLTFCTRMCNRSERVLWR